MSQILLFLPVLGSDVSKSVKCKSAWIKDFTADGTYRSAKLRKFIAVRVINAALAPCCLTPDILSFTLFLHEVPLPPSQGEGSITVKLPVWRAGAHAKADLITISAFTVIADAQVDAVTLVRHTVTGIYCEELPNLCIQCQVPVGSIPSIPAQSSTAQHSQLTTQLRVPCFVWGEGYFRNLNMIGWKTRKIRKIWLFFCGKKIFKLQLRGLDQLTFQLVKTEFPTMTEITIYKRKIQIQRCTHRNVHNSMCVNERLDNSNCLSVRERAWLWLKW